MSYEDEEEREGIPVFMPPFGAPVPVAERVAYDQFQGWAVSTVKVLMTGRYETAVEVAERAMGPHFVPVSRCDTLEEAEAAHARWIEVLKKTPELLKRLGDVAGDQS